MILSTPIKFIYRPAHSKVHVELVCSCGSGHPQQCRCSPRLKTYPRCGKEKGRAALETYLLTNRISQSEFAGWLEVTQGFVHQMLNGRSRITAERAIQIEHVTGGAITRAELRPDVFGHDPIEPKQEERPA